jgi:hypothetical protein
MLGKTQHKYMLENDTQESLILWFDMTVIFRRHSPTLKIFRQTHVALECHVEVRSEVSKSFH